MAPFIELRNITKSFGSVQANDNISLKFNKGEIHTLLGENGAGKTTLMNILFGLYRPDGGEILINGQPVQISNPRDAISAGIGMVHQHFMLAKALTVTENVMVGEEETHFGVVLNRRDAATRIREISSQHGLEVNPDDFIKDLSVGIQQRVEIIKLLYRSADFLIFDEPTAVLTPQETEKLFLIMKSLASEGKTIIFITHKLKEVMKVADRISILRAGKLVTTTTCEEVNEEKMASLMVGREVILKVDKKPPKTGEVLLKVLDLKVLDDRNNSVVNDISFEVRSGEIFGIAGVQGNGQSELIESLTGLRPPIFGKIFINGLETTDYSPREIIEQGVSHIPEDRQGDGLVLNSPVSTNLVLCSFYKPPFTKGNLLKFDAIEKNAKKQILNFDIRTTDPGAMVSTLSGGNQQKVIVGREFSRFVRLLIVSQPTRGLDVGSIEYVHKQIVKKRDDGAAVLLVSTELDEILALSDRIAVIYRGRIMDILESKNVSREKIGLLMAGINPKAALKVVMTREGDKHDQ